MKLLSPIKKTVVGKAVAALFRFLLAEVAMAIVLAGGSAPAQTFTLLYSFTGGTDGGTPYGGVITDVNGNLYGTTDFGGINNSGTIFKLTP